MTKSLRDQLRIPADTPVDMDALDARAMPLAPGGKKKSAAAMRADGERLAALQEALYAAGARARRSSCCRGWTPRARAAPSST